MVHVCFFLSWNAYNNNFVTYHSTFCLLGILMFSMIYEYYMYCIYVLCIMYIVSIILYICTYMYFYIYIYIYIIY